jgi:hypothetical protein
MRLFSLTVDDGADLGNLCREGERCQSNFSL